MARHLLVVNGQRREVEADPTMPLLWVLRDRLELFGTRFGCGLGMCGACTVLEDGLAVRSCMTTIADTAGKSYTTIEGLSANGDHPCQRAWIDQDVAQCGFCQAGMILETAALLRTRAAPTDRDIDDALRGHVCRCGTYDRLRRAVKLAADYAKGGPR
jgi:aerobic-type carbon monoxide dehydrogenase small subunit (CoxS/CutS family)